MKSTIKIPDPEFMTLPCDLTEEEVRVKSDQLAAACAERDALVEEKKEITSDFGGRIKHRDAQISLLAKAVSTKTEPRKVECIWRSNFTSGQMELRRTDTMKVVDMRPMKDSDKQMTIDPASFCSPKIDPDDCHPKASAKKDA